MNYDECFEHSKEGLAGYLLICKYNTCFRKTWRGIDLNYRGQRDFHIYAVYKNGTLQLVLMRGTE